MQPKRTCQNIFVRFQKKALKSLITRLPAPPSVGTARLPVGRDYEMITTIKNSLKINDNLCNNFLE